MNLSDLVALHDAILDAVWSCDIPQSAVVERAKISAHTFAETHIDFETATHQFWIAVRLDGSIKVYRHSKTKYLREQFTIQPLAQRQGFQFVSSMLQNLIDGKF
jgi:hypothetical protein